MVMGLPDRGDAHATRAVDASWSSTWCDITRVLNIASASVREVLNITNRTTNQISKTTLPVRPPFDISSITLRLMISQCDLVKSAAFHKGNTHLFTSLSGLTT